MKTRFVLLLLLLFVLPTVVFAHTRYEAPPYAFVVGWVEEPPVVDGNNAIYIEILENEQPFIGAEQTLDAQLQYAGQKYTMNIHDTDAPGIYHSDTFIPTVRGTLDVLLTGELNGTTIELLTEPEEVVSAGQLHFPERLPSQFEQLTQLNDLADQVRSARLFGLVGTVLGVLGVGVGAFSLFKRNSQK